MQEHVKTDPEHKERMAALEREMRKADRLLRRMYVRQYGIRSGVGGKRKEAKA